MDIDTMPEWADEWVNGEPYNGVSSKEKEGLEIEAKEWIRSRPDNIKELCLSSLLAV